MNYINKILLVWLIVMWIVFSGWIFVVTQFPLNFSFIGIQFITGLAMIWTMIQVRDL